MCVWGGGGSPGCGGVENLGHAVGAAHAASELVGFARVARLAVGAAAEILLREPDGRRAKRAGASAPEVAGRVAEIQIGGGSGVREARLNGIGTRDGVARAGEVGLELGPVEHLVV